MMKGLYGNAYGTLLANVENLTPAAQGGGLSPLQLSRWTGTSEFATMSTMNTPPANASPTVPYPGQPQYGLQQGPNYATVTSYGDGWSDYLPSWMTGGSAAPASPSTWSGSGGYKYSLIHQTGLVVATPPSGAQFSLSAGTRGYTAILSEGLAVSGLSGGALASLQKWLEVAKKTPETKPNPGVPVSAPAPVDTPTDVPPPAEGMDLTTKIALGVLAVSVVGGAAFFFLRRGKKV